MTPEILAVGIYRIWKLIWFSNKGKIFLWIKNRGGLCFGKIDLQ